MSYWSSDVPHWLLGSTNLVLSVIAVTVPLVGRRFVDTPLDGPLAILWGLSLFPGLIVPVLYLRTYSKVSRFFSAVAWVTLTLWIAALAYSLAFIGA